MTVTKLRERFTIQAEYADAVTVHLGTALLRPATSRYVYYGAVTAVAVRAQRPSFLSKYGHCVTSGPCDKRRTCRPTGRSVMEQRFRSDIVDESAVGQIGKACRNKSVNLRRDGVPRNHTQLVCSAQTVCSFLS